MKWSPQQSAALDAAGQWHKDRSAPIFRLFGYAGTGKTTLAKHLAEQIGGKTCYAAFTGKAALVMRKNGCEGASTIHSLIYSPKQDSQTGEVSFVLDKDGPASDADLIVVDECSMVGEDLARDLLSFEKPVLVLGDPAQLPPVKGGGYFTDADPDHMLTEIHRQAGDNPIIRLATDVREGRELEFGRYGDSIVVRKAEINPQAVTAADQVLVGLNKTRTAYNHRLREIRGFKTRLPEVDDRVICLRNDKALGIFNGGIFTVTKPAKEAPENRLKFSVKSEDFDAAAMEVEVRRECFEGRISEVDWRELRGTQQFDFAQAVTVHKSQGSQWPTVTLFDESGAFRQDARRWLYTGVTRASEAVIIARAA